MNRKTLQAALEDYAASVYPGQTLATLPPRQRLEIKRAFYAGAITVASAALEIARGKVTDIQGTALERRLLEDLDECTSYAGETATEEIVNRNYRHD